MNFLSEERLLLCLVVCIVGVFFTLAIISTTLGKLEKDIKKLVEKDKNGL